MKKIFALTFAAAMGCATHAVAACETGDHGAISIKVIDGVCTAVIYGDSAASEAAKKKGAYKTLEPFTATVQKVVYTRTNATKNKNWTIVLPFDVGTSCSVSGANFYEFGNPASNKDTYVDLSSGESPVWTVRVSKNASVKDGVVNKALVANSPYAFEFVGGHSFTISGCDIAMDAAKFSANVVTEDASNWQIVGTYSQVVWNEGHKDLGSVYGVAANAKDGVNAGSFVKAKAGASIAPMRAYLQYKPSMVAAKAAAGVKFASAADLESLPETILFALGEDDAPTVEFPEGECFDGNTDIIEFKTVNGKKTACIDGQSEARLQTLSIPEDVVVDDVVYNRNFKLQTASTIMLPFSIPVNSVSIAVFYKIIALVKHCDQYCNWMLDVEGMRNAENGSETDWLMANTPYIIWPGSEQLTFNTHWWDDAAGKQNESVTLNTTNGNKSTVISAVMNNKGDQTTMLSSWSFMGTYERIVWDNPSGIYGFASVAKKVNDKDVAAGEFVKAKSGANIAPMRAYLKYNGISSLAKSIAGTYLEEDLPETITIRFLDGDGSTTAIGSMNTLTGEIKMDDNVWFDMKGRKMNHKPTVKGTYYNKGQKVIIK
ncbi:MULTISPECIES: hypothetical protein [unclassified Fibrobacter]|uniref:hypothetical protein n=1 Tax=unclassified Fibrobacter TaxID=2634177 RepID=UPI000D6D62B5|nr:MULTISPECIES: hypothetical protein [unclassified Fibrobacter]